VLLTDRDIYHFREGTYFGAHEKLGAHVQPSTPPLAVLVLAPG
jgi:hypothetical protein